MITRILIPQAFENMEEATIGAWRKAEGDAVQPGDVLCELITEKTTFDLEAEGEGLLRRIVAPEKSVVPVGFIIGLIGESGADLPDVSAENAAVRKRKQQAGTSEQKSETTLKVPSLSTPANTVSTAESATQRTPASATRVRATPAARRAAREHNVAIEDVATALPGKVLSEDDVINFAVGR